MASTMQLEFSQAMSDFKTMFPEMDRDVIEAVLRANQGAVDATIDQLLAMSTDNQNEKLRNELEKSGNNSPIRNVTVISSSTSESQKQSQGIDKLDGKTVSLTNTSSSPPPPPPQQNNSNSNLLINTGASPKVKKSIVQSQHSTPIKIADGQKKWNPPLLGPLPQGFLRLTNVDSTRTDYDLPDEQFALMLQNEEFMNELRWNQEFMNALEKEQQERGRGEDDAAFKERLKHMGKVSRKKFLQMARVFTWQRNKKNTSAKQIDSLPLKEEPSDDEDLAIKK